MNKYRLTTNVHLLKNKEYTPILGVDNLLTTLYLSNSPYEIREGIRYIRNTDKLLKGTSNKITAIDSNKKTFSYNSIAECAKNINLSSYKIRKCLNTGKSLKGYTFVLN